MRPLDLLLFLFGHRDATERIAGTRHAWMIGALLVLSAGIARNYDHLDLLRQPEWFIGPFAASLVSILFIFACLCRPLRLGAVGGIGKQLGIFLTLAWLTAPCAWLYGIPVEMMTDIVTATKWNIAFLAIVALWRVAIMVRAVSVLSGAPALRVLPLILAPAAFEMMAGSFFKSLSLIGIMGGVRLPPHTELLKRASDFTATAAFWTFLAAWIACWIIRGRASKPLDRPDVRMSRSCVSFVLVSLLLWSAAAVPFHNGIANRNHLSELVLRGDYQAAVAFASSKSRADFSRHHHLPPSPDDFSFPLELLDALPPDAPAWLRDEWTANAIELLSRDVRVLGRKPDFRHYPQVFAALTERASALRAASSRSGEDDYWLRSFDEATKAVGPNESR